MNLVGTGRVRRHRLWLGVAVGSVCWLLISGCTRESEPGPSAGDAYEVVLDWLMEQPEVRFGDQCDDNVVFIESLGSNEIELDVQVDVVNRYEDDFEIRFIDTRSEAIEGTQPDARVRDGCVLIGLGPVFHDETAEVGAEMYHDADVAAYRFDLVQRSGVWRLGGAPTRSDAVGLDVER